MMDTVLTFGKSQSGVTNTRPVTSFHWTTLCAECDQADSRQLCIEKFLNQDSKRSKLFDVARRYRNVCRCVPMCAKLCRCVPMCANACQCVPMCANVPQGQQSFEFDSYILISLLQCEPLLMVSSILIISFTIFIASNKVDGPQISKLFGTRIFLSLEPSN